MMSTRTKNVKYVFLPAVLLSVFLLCSSTLFHIVRTNLLDLYVDPMLFSDLQIASLIPPTILVLILLLVSKRQSFDRVCKGTLLAMIGIASLLACLTFVDLGIILFYVVSSIFSLLLPFSFSFFSLLIWGFVNRVTTTSEGIKYYLPLAFVLYFVGVVSTNLVLRFVGPLINSWPFFAFVIPAIVLMVMALATFHWAWSKFPEATQTASEVQIDTQAPAQDRFPFFSAAYLLAGCVILQDLLEQIFRWSLISQDFDPSAAHFEFMGRYMTAFSLSAVVVAIVWVVLGTWMLVKNEKSWRVLALYGAISVFIGAVLCFGLEFLFESATWLSQGICAGMLVSTKHIVFFPFIQILYLHLSPQMRFRAKVITEMIALPLIIGGVLFSVQGLIVLFDSLTAIVLPLKVCFLVLLVLLVVAARRIQKDATILG